MSESLNPRLPAGALVAAIDRLAHQTGETPLAVYERLGVAPRVAFAWRTGPRATVSAIVADRVVTASPFLWFDVWPECPAHTSPAAGCPDCLAHFQARLAFTGTRVPADLVAA